MALVTANEIPGASVYGIPQMSYTVDGESGRDYAAAVTAATLRQATAFEAECNAMSAMVKQRMAKLEELGDALSIIARVLASMKTGSGQSPSDTVSDNDLLKVKNIMEKYEIFSEDAVDDNGNKIAIVLTVKDGKQTVTRARASYAQNDIQYAMDREDNDLQQNLVTVQSAFTKRDNAFNNASSLVNKSHNSAQSIIGNFGE